MPIIIPKNLPANKILSKENIFVMNRKRAKGQDIRAMEILLLNLMPTKIETETQITRLLGNTPLQVNLTLLKTDTYKSQNTKETHLEAFYKTFSEIKDKYFDGLIITGAPVETLDFEDVTYWDELARIMEYSKTHVTSTFHICWGAQAGLYYHYGINKRPLPKKQFGCYLHTISENNSKLLRGFDDFYFAPHSRHTENRKEDIEKVDDLIILSESKEAGVYITATKDYSQIFVSGHSEYDFDTLLKEYERDVNKGLDIDVPKNYFLDDDPKKDIMVRWRAHANLLFANWINYCVYQETPFELG